ncbi:MAG: class I SAM-dependent methyltransferase [Candidatus Paceibacterota bacterium]
MYKSSGIHFTDPEQVINKLDLAPEAVVADFGSGPGAYTFALARKLSAGRVYAVDIQKDLLEKLRREARAAHLGNIEIIWGEISRVGGVKLADAKLDAIVVSNVLFQIDAKYQLVLEAKRLLKPGGRLLLVDWSESFSHLGPRPEEVVPAAAAEQIFTEAGLTAGEPFSAGPHHYGIIFTKK